MRQSRIDNSEIQEACGTGHRTKTNQKKNTTQKAKTMSNTNVIKKTGDEPKCPRKD